MDQLLILLETINNSVNKVVWGTPLLILFLLAGILFSVRTGFFQITRFKDWMRNTILACFGKKDALKSKDDKSISQWQALTTALASTSGTGNIAGVATALAVGGPGAIFWMWVSAILGMMTHYAEIVLGMHYRYKDEDGEWIGGPMVYIERGLKCKPLACIFAFFCVIATFGIGNMSQSNSMAEAVSNTLNVSRFLVGAVTAFLVFLVIMGGVKRIASVCEKIVPFMSVMYIAGALIVIFTHYTNIPAAFISIFQEAFNIKAAGSGVLGYGIAVAMKKGISRGVFTNEAGLGSSVMVHAVSDAKEPAVQGMWGIFEVFADTLVVCTITAIAILCSGVYNQNTYLTAMLTDKTQGGTALFDALPNGVSLTSAAFGSTFGAFGETFITLAIVLFALATLVGWSYYGEKGCEYLFGKKSISVYKVIYVVFIIIGAVLRLELVWSLSDTFNGLMAIPNLIAILLLSGQVFKITKDYLKRGK